MIVSGHSEPAPREAPRPVTAGSSGFSLLEVVLGMVILAMVFLSLSAFTKVNRKTLGKTGKTAQAYAVASAWSEGVKALYEDAALVMPGPKTRFDSLYNKLAVGAFDTAAAFVRNNVTYSAGFSFRRIENPGNTANNMIVARGRVVWDSTASGNKHIFTWGLILGRPLL